MIKDKDGDIVHFDIVYFTHPKRFKKYIAFYYTYAIAGAGDSIGEALAMAYLKKHVYEKPKVILVKMLKKQIEENRND
jgi:hypothetical protein